AGEHTVNKPTRRGRRSCSIARPRSSHRLMRAAVLATPAALAAGALLSAATPTRAANQYWDINGANIGATDDIGGDVSGTWDSITPNFTTDVNGTSTTIVWGSGTPVFSAGTNGIANGSIITVVGAKTVAGMTFEEGNLTLNG